MSGKEREESRREGGREKGKRRKKGGEKKGFWTKEIKEG